MVSISATKFAKIHKLAKTMPQLTKVAGLLQRAEEQGTLGPEEVKDIAEDTKQILLSVVEMVDDIVEGVPAEDVLEEPTEEPTEGVPEGPTEPEIPTVQGQEDEDDKDKKTNEKMAKLQNEIKLMKEASTHKDLTIKYGKLFPEQVRVAREKEFANSKDSIPVLEARIKEASTILTDRKAVKVAQLTTTGETYFDDDDYSNDSNNLDFKGKL